MVLIQLDSIITASQRAADELRAELEQVLPDLPAGAGEAIEGIEIDVRGYECCCAMECQYCLQMESEAVEEGGGTNG